MTEIVYEAELRPESRQGVVDGLVAFNRSKTTDFTGQFATIGLLLKQKARNRVAPRLSTAIQCLYAQGRELAVFFS